MSGFVPRTCTEIPEQAAGDARRPPTSRPLEAFRDEPAYVLLGDPGAGKSTAFEHECEALGDMALCLPARDFLTLNPSRHPEWDGRILFIDGLDEVRAGAPNARTPFDEIRQRLDALGNPPFRLSCRQADWLGASDRRHLDTVSPGGKVTVLQLDPLTSQDVSAILVADPRIGDPDAFIRQARQRRIDGLLHNPQSLDLLIGAVTDEDWPDGRLETFEKACRRLVTEKSKEHATAIPCLPPEKLLAAAGKLCAHSLVAGTGGYVIHSTDATPDCPDLNRCVPDDLEAGRQVVATRLFTADVEGRFAPVHRHIAEFLGGRYLAGAIKDGLPLRRVLALMTGADGTVVTQLRGLSAWLAAHCPHTRRELIERDPTGVALYGDLRTLSADDKRALLQSLARIGPRRLPWFQVAAFAPLASPDLEPTFLEILNDSARDTAHQQLVRFVLWIVTEGVPIPDLSMALRGILQDDTWQSYVNAAALDAFTHCYQGQDKPEVLRSVLADITKREELDPDGDMLGTLLSSLYPATLSTAEVWDYLTERDDPDELYLGSYAQFWQSDLSRQSSDQQVLELLDGCVPRITRVRAALASHSMEDVLPSLVALGLKAGGDVLNPERLYDWLGLGLAADGASIHGEAVHEVRAWLAERPDKQKAAILEGIRRCPDSDGFLAHALQIGERLYQADPPADLETWFLEQALAWSEESPRRAEFLLQQAIRTGQLDIADVRQRLADDPFLTSILNRWLVPPRETPESRELRQDRLRYDEERRGREDDWIDALRSQEASLRDNSAPPRMLYELARRFFGSFSGFRPSHGRERLAKDVGHDLQLTESVVSALRDVPSRSDVPNLDAILRLHGERRMHYLGLPYLAGLAMAEAVGPLSVSAWTPERRRTAVALYLTFPHADYEPEWYRHLVAEHPEDVADAQVRLATAALRQGREAHYNLWHLAHDPSHAGVARLASLPLLATFPARGGSDRIATLDQLLWAAIQHSDPKALHETLARKLSRKSLSPLQRCHWLAAGCVISPETYREGIVALAGAGRREGRARHLLAFFCSDDHLAFSLDDLDVATVQLLVQLGGATVGPDAWRREGIVDGVMRASGFVRQLIQRLSQDPSTAASDALEALLAEASLARWCAVIEDAIDDQKVVRRDRSYRHPSFDQVVETLSGGDPANPGDLAALTADLLRELAGRMHDNSNRWRPYWNEDSHQRATEPKPENSCRDVLVEYLRSRLPTGIDVQPEARYANEKRADIRLARGDFHVPVEIKKNGHRDLWSAIRHQLIGQYAIDPATDGYGVYVVLWFGKDQTQPAPSGKRPADAAVLEKRLSEALSEEERRRVSVCVINVSGS